MNTQFEKKGGGWDYSTIMRRGHEIARSLGSERAYNRRLSEGLRQAWKEAKSESKDESESVSDIVVKTMAGDWEKPKQSSSPLCPPFYDEEKKEVARFHKSARSLGDGLECVSTEDVKYSFENEHIDITYTEDIWFVSVVWRDQTIANFEARTYLDLCQLMTDTVLDVECLIPKVEAYAAASPFPQEMIASRLLDISLGEAWYQK